MQRTLLVFTIFSTQLFYAQREVVFEYDEAGSQIYRGEKKSLKTNSEKLVEEIKPHLVIESKTEEEKRFWAGIELAPVPVRETLSIQIHPKIKENLSEIFITDMLGNVRYHQRNISRYSEPIRVNMQHYIEGVYVVRFHLKDGKIYTQSILKH